MKKLILLSLLLASEGVFAQIGKITGKVFGSNSQKLEGTVVSLLKARDSSFVKASITDMEGIYEFENIKKDTFLLNISHLGYQKYTSGLLILVDDQLEIPLIKLNELAKELSEVTVTAKKAFVERKIDRTIINPDALIGNAGSNSLEILEKAPGIQVDVDGNISLKGRAGVMVFIDDKPTYLSAADLAGYLRSLPVGICRFYRNYDQPNSKI
jgi:iron complex outermembrane receptor protein